MATFEKRGNKYRVRVRIRNVEKSATFERKADAQAWAARMETSVLDNAQGNAKKGMYFSDVMTRYMLEVTPSKRGERSETYRIKRALKTFIAEIPMTDLKPSDFALWRDNRLKEVSGDSVRRELETLSAICDYATKEWGLLPSNPVLQISKPKKSKPRDNIPTDKEIEKICLALGYEEDRRIETVSQRVAVALLFAVETAMRAGEICNLTWNYVYFNRRVAHLEMTKNGSSRDVPLSKRAIELLEKLPKDDDLVFNLKASVLDTMFRRARDNMEIKNFHFHDTRHKALTRMADKLEPMQLAKVSGHKDLKILLNTYYNPDIGSLASLLD